jgi:hypothetical protein
MQFGWTDPQIRDMRAGGAFDLTVPTTFEETKKVPAPLLLYDSNRGDKEFFILEYRNAGAVRFGQYDRDVASNGLTIWHVKHGNDKFPINLPTDDGKKKVTSVYNRGAPSWIHGGAKLYTKENGEIPLGWMDRTDSGVRLKVNNPADGDKLSVSWSGPQRSGASIMQGGNGNLEAVVHEGNSLVHWFFNGRAWARAGVVSSKATGPGSICLNKNGHYEYAVLEGKNLVHDWNKPAKPYNRNNTLISNKATGPGAMMFSAVGNLECVVPEGNKLVHYWARDGRWTGPSLISTKATGPGGIAQNLDNGNLEVVALEGNELVHYWATPGKPWKRAGVITSKATGPGSIVHWNSFGLEVIVPEGNELVNYRARGGKGWVRVRDAINKNTSRMGVGALCGGSNRHLELILLENNQLVHYSIAPGQGWRRGSAF